MIQDPEMPEYNNAAFAYEYTQRTLEKANKSLDVLNAKLSGALAFSGVLLKFTESFCADGWRGWIKVGICCLCAGSIIVCGLGLSPQKTGDVVDPEEFLDPTIYRLSEERCNLFVMRQAVQAVREIDLLIEERCGHLNLAISLVVLASVGVAINIAFKY